MRDRKPIGLVGWALALACASCLAPAIPVPGNPTAPSAAATSPPTAFDAPEQADAYYRSKRLPKDPLSFNVRRAYRLAEEVRGRLPLYSTALGREISGLAAEAAVARNRRGALPRSGARHLATAARRRDLPKLEPRKDLVPSRGRKGRGLSLGQ